MTDQPDRRKSRPLIYALNRLLITFSYAILAAIIVTLVVRAFSMGAEIGVKSLAAAALPPIIITYIALFSRRTFNPSDRFSPVGFYFIFLLWMIALMIVINFVDSYLSYAVPLGIVISSLTLSGLVFLTRKLSFVQLLSCSYGIVSGLLIYTLLFGFSITQ